MNTDLDKEQWQVCRPYAELVIATVSMLVCKSRGFARSDVTHLDMASEWLDTFERRMGWSKD